MKTLTIAAALTASLLSTTALAQGKVGVINLTKVFDDFWRTKQADAQIKAIKYHIYKHGKAQQPNKNQRESFCPTHA